MYLETGDTTSRAIGHHAIVYARCVNPPYLGGTVCATRSLTQAIALTGLSPIVLNFKYDSSGDRRFRPGTESLGYEQVDQRVLGIARDRMIGYHQRSSFPAALAVALVAEPLLMPLLYRRERLVRPSVTHVVNCCKLPRSILRRIDKTPVVSHVFGAGTWQNKIRSGLGRIDATVVSSERAALALKAQDLGHLVFTIPPLVSDHFFRSRSDSSRNKVVLYLGRLAHHRFPDQLLEVFLEVTRAQPDATFRIIAPSTQESIERAMEIRRACNSLGIEHSVSIMLRNVGERTKFGEYSNATCLVFCPERECGESIFPPLTVLEAMASGLPVISTDTCATGEAVVHGKNGFLVRSSEYARIADRVIEAARAEDEVWNRWSFEARRFAHEHFSIQSGSRRIESLYSSIGVN